MAVTDYPTVRPGPAAARLVGGGLALALVLCLVGWAVVAAWPNAGFLRELRVNEWFEANRTPMFDQLTFIGSYLSDTKVCIAVVIVSAIALRLWLGRWRESITVIIAILGELTVFLIVTALVGRDRPDVLRLDPAPPTSSFPSGHVAAAVALYGCLAIIMLRELRPHWLGVVVCVVLCAIPVIVAISRIYRGMHYPSDVLFGFLGGGAWLLLTVTTLLPRSEWGRDPDPANARPQSVGASHG